MELLSRQKGLPGLGVDEKRLTREKRLLRWLKARGWDLTTDVARIMGVHRTFPGKCLIACTDPLPREMRQKLLAAGVPLAASAVGEQLSEVEAGFLARAHASGSGVVDTSSVGRLFDMVASVLGIAAGIPMFIAGQSLWSFLTALGTSVVVTLIWSAIARTNFDFNRLVTEITDLD